MTGTDADVHAIATIRQKLEAAENATDPDAVATLLSEDVVLMVPDFEVQEGKSACVTFLRDVMSWMRAHLNRRISYVSAEVAVLGAVAFDRGTFSFDVSPKSGGDTEQVTGKYLWLLTREEHSVWKVWRVIISRDEDSGEEESDEDNG